jgi:hypothetical protein
LKKIVDHDEANQIKAYLDSIVGQKLYKEEQKKLVDTIALKDSRGRKLRSISVLNAYLIENYGKTIISKTTMDKNRKNMRFWQVTCVPVLQDLD